MSTPGATPRVRGVVGDSGGERVDAVSSEEVPVE